MTRQTFFAIILVVGVSLAGCGGSSGGSSGSTANNGAEFVGSWNMLTERGRTPAENGYNSLILELTQTTLRSTIDSPTFNCAWSGDLSYTSSTITVAVTQGEGMCAAAVGSTRNAAWSVSGNLLTLDWEGANGQLQVYERM
ncbi:MAG: hypothetical protein OEZ04_09050 [Nitrospinota bacterium]|nr:hypothetical protein [Nitrospinota bacterium]